MGLDIYKCKAMIIPDDYDNFELRDLQPYINLTEEEKTIDKKIFEKFKKKLSKFITYKNIEYYDFKKYFDDYGLDFDDYKWHGGINNKEYFVHKDKFEYINNIYEDEDITTYDVMRLFKKITHFNSDFIVINLDKCPIYTIKSEIIYYKELQGFYQRKEVNSSFYEKILKESNNFNDEINYIVSNRDLKLIKKYTNKNCDMRKWHIEEDEFIYFSY